ncbi:hypothetical protein WA026_007652 [Henosepilachna vigintioctopunctata]|uniref:Neurotransmitter-gated ion-channel ligand-binding domain-containing protein n=1 Tax=Henosepilachna vigintioctopunctata TaxID=420089 RepID=A0AAW1TUN6_9CUCU
MRSVIFKEEIFIDVRCFWWADSNNMNETVSTDSSINMFYFNVVLFLCVINITKARIRRDILTEKCQNVSKNVDEVKLMDHIFCDFNGNNLRPVKDNKIATNLTIRLVPQSFAYNWVDQHSNWNPKEFNGIDKVYLRESGLWKPDLLLFNRADRSKLGQFTNKISCRLRYTGLYLALQQQDMKRLAYQTFQNFLTTLRSANLDLVLGSTAEIS